MMRSRGAVVGAGLERKESMYQCKILGRKNSQGLGMEHGDRGEEGLEDDSRVLNVGASEDRRITEANP